MELSEGTRVEREGYGLGTVVEPSLPGMLKVEWDHGPYDAKLGDRIASSEWDLLDGAEIPSLKVLAEPLTQYEGDSSNTRFGI